MNKSKWLMMSLIAIRLINLKYQVSNGLYTSSYHDILLSLSPYQKVRKSSILTDDSVIRVNVQRKVSSHDHVVGLRNEKMHKLLNNSSINHYGSEDSE